MTVSARTVLYPEARPLTAATASRDGRFHLSRAAEDAWARFASNNGWNQSELADAVAGLEAVPEGMLAEKLQPPAVPMWNPEYPILMWIAIPEGDRVAIIGARKLRRAGDKETFRMPKGKYGRLAWEWLAAEKKTATVEPYRAWLDDMLARHSRYAGAAELAEVLPGFAASGESSTVKDEKALRASIFRRIKQVIGERMEAQPNGISGEYAAAVLDQLRLDLKAVVLHWTDADDGGGGE